MLNMESIKVEGKSKINGITVVGFSASFPISGDEKISLSQIVFDEGTYNANKSQCDSDFESFKNEAKKYSQKIKTI